MAYLKDLFVRGNSRILGSLTTSDLLSANGGIALNSSTTQSNGAPAYLLGIKAFAEGGNVIWQSKDSVSVGHAANADNASYANSAGSASSAGTASKLGTNAGGATSPVYFSGGVPVACTMTAPSNRWEVLTSVGGDGVLEVGKYIDFHNSDGDSADYSYRITTDTSTLTGSGAIAAGTTLSSTTSTSVGTSLSVGTSASIGTTLTVGSYITMTNSNPYVKFTDTANGNQVYYIQGYQGKFAFGPTFSSAVQTDVNGNMTLPGSASLTPRATETGSVGTSSYKWNAMYANTFYGNATSANKLTVGTTLTSATVDSFLEAGVVKWACSDSSAVGSNDGLVMSFGWSGTYGAQVWLDDGSGEGGMKIRNRTSTSWNPWRQVFTEYNYNDYVPKLDGTGATGTWAITSSAANHVNNTRSIGGDDHAKALKAEFDANKASIPRNSLLTYYSSAYGNGSFYQGYFLTGYDSNPYGGFFVAHYGTPYYVGIQSGSYKQSQLWKAGDSVTGAVWNDYAEYRESDCEEFGRVLIEKGDDSLTQSTERLQHFAGISSDTWGFCQGETEKAKTPIAVAGRVLAYPYQDRNNYKPGDCVCAAPGGTVDIMTREEVINWPDRIIGTVSCVPDYEEWGSGDRDPVKVNGRIWIKVK